MKSSEMDRRAFLKFSLRFAFGVVGVVGASLGGHAIYRDQRVEERVSEQHPRPTQEELSRADEYLTDLSLQRDLSRGQEAVQTFREDAEYWDAKAKEYEGIKNESAASAIALGATTVYAITELTDT